MSAAFPYPLRQRFYRDLAILLNSGIPMERALGQLKEKYSGYLYYLVEDLQFQAGVGFALWQTLEQHADLFPSLDAAVIRGGETGGRLPDALLSLSRYYERRRREKRRAMAGLIYPLILLHAAILLPPIYLLVKNQIWEYFRVTAPALLGGYALLALGTLLWKTVMKEGTPREKFDRFILFLPKVGRILRDSALQRVLWSLAIQLDAGVEAVLSARNSAAAAANLYIRGRLESALYVVENGRSFKDYFTVSGIMDSDALSLLQTAEISGQIPASLLNLVRWMEAETSVRLTVLIKVVVGFTYFIAALIVALTVLSFFMSSFNLPSQ